MILVVDDSATARKLLRAMLEKQGYRVVEARDGDDALAQAVLHRPDLIVLDVMMPSKTGVQVSATLKGHSEFKNIPILLFTGISGKTGKGEAHWKAQAFADDFLSKPAKAAELLARIERLLERGKG